jgi:hypothetical protein
MLLINSGTPSFAIILHFKSLIPAAATKTSKPPALQAKLSMEFIFGNEKN